MQTKIVGQLVVENKESVVFAARRDIAVEKILKKGMDVMEHLVEKSITCVYLNQEVFIHFYRNGLGFE